MDDFIIKSFYDKMFGVDLRTYGILDANGNIHTLGTDSKMIGRIFEMFVQPILAEIAEESGYILETPAAQNHYPDFILTKGPYSRDKIAIDVKTTYVKDNYSPIKFALGSYASYLRNNTSSIEYQYTDYCKHYVIGFVYRRNGYAQESAVYPISSLNAIPCPYWDVRYFIQEKYKIAGDTTGSGNTENMGSFVTNDFDRLVCGHGPFNELGLDVFELYWSYYPRYKDKEKIYTSLEGFFNWFLQQGSPLPLLHQYNYSDVLARIEGYKIRHNL